LRNELNKLLRWIAQVFGKDGYIKVQEEFAMNWQQILEKAMQNIENLDLGVVLEGFQIAASEGYQAAVHYVVLAHSAKEGAEAAGVTVEQAKKVLKGAVLQLH